MYVGKDPRCLLGKRGAPGNDVDVTRLGFALLATAQPSRIDTDATDIVGLPRRVAGDGLRLESNVELDFGVKRFAHRVRPIPRATERDAFVQRKNLLEQDRGLSEWQMGGPFHLQVLQLRRHPFGKCLAQRARGVPRGPCDSR